MGRAYTFVTHRNSTDTAMAGKPEFVDVLAIGASLARISSACRLRRNMPTAVTGKPECITTGAPTT